MEFKITLSIVLSVVIILSTLLLAPLFISIPVKPLITSEDLNAITLGNWSTIFNAIITRENSWYVVKFFNGTYEKISTELFLHSKLRALILIPANFSVAYVYYYQSTSGCKLLAVKAYYTGDYYSIPYRFYSSVEGVKGEEGPYYWVNSGNYWIAYSNQTQGLSILVLIKTTNFTLSKEAFKSLLQLLTTSNQVLSAAPLSA